MILLPAIDLLGGRAVRLLQGRREQARVYSEDPPALAAALVAQGARALHVVDLDAAFGGPRQRALIAEVVRAAAVPVQLGGGLRSLSALDEAFAAGAQRAVIGSAALDDPSFVERAVARFGRDRIAVALDVKQGRPAARGWVEERDGSPADLARRFAEAGAGCIVHTAVDRDGTLAGPDLDGLGAVCAAAPLAEIVASGGVGELAHLLALAAAAPANVGAVIVGKALLEERFTVRDAQDALRGVGR